MVTVNFDNGFVLEAPFLDGYHVDSGNQSGFTSGFFFGNPDHQKI
jgi:hypothetical protein